MGIMLNIGFEERQCKYYKKHAKEDYLFGRKQTFCEIEKCPYKKQIEPELSGEKLPKICKSKGLVKKFVIKN